MGCGLETRNGLRKPRPEPSESLIRYGGVRLLSQGRLGLGDKDWARIEKSRCPNHWPSLLLGGPSVALMQSADSGVRHNLGARFPTRTDRPKGASLSSPKCVRSWAV